MHLTITPQLQATWQQIREHLKGPQRRLFMASVVKGAGPRLASFFAKTMNWNPATIRKGMHELTSGIACLDAYDRCGRKPLEASLLNLEKDLHEMGQATSQTDPTFRTNQLYRKLTAGEARRRLIEEKGYDAKTAPSERTLRRKLSALGYKPRRVAKTKPLRKVKETNAIFDTLKRTNAEADADPGTIRLSIDTKAVVAIGNLSRGGKSRQKQETLDHDFAPESKLTPFGIFRPETNETCLFFTTGNATSDFMVDRLNELWPTLKKTVILHIPSCSTVTMDPKIAEPEHSGSNV
jgi:hypothetical protein